MKIGVIGGGAWGTSLALIAARSGNNVTIWSRNDQLASEINTAHTNTRYLPKINLLSSIKATSDIKEMLAQNALLLSIPAQNIRQLCLDLLELKLPHNVILIICSKGIEQDSLKLMSEVVAEVLPMNTIAILSGPNFAYPVAQDLPAITSIAASNIKLSFSLADAFSNVNFRIYANDDIIGTQIFGAVKNVLAIATGIAIGKNLGENAKAAIVSRGICEINALSLAMGGKIETLLSPAAIGDVHLTCSSLASRNTSYGIALASGEVQKTCLVEGYFTSKSISQLAAKFAVEMPICQAVYQVTHGYISLEVAIRELLNRPNKLT
jgi:glycerol-3-phosphate dehydrogenase (NAD(P)+)